MKATVRAAVKRVLRKRNLRPEDFDGVAAQVLRQAEAMRKDWVA